MLGPECDPWHARPPPGPIILNNERRGGLLVIRPSRRSRAAPAVCRTFVDNDDCLQWPRCLPYQRAWLPREAGLNAGTSDHAAKQSAAATTQRSAEQIQVRLLAPRRSRRSVTPVIDSHFTTYRNALALCSRLAWSSRGDCPYLA